MESKWKRPGRAPKSRSGPIIASNPGGGVYSRKTAKPCCRRRAIPHDHAKTPACRPPPASSSACGRCSCCSWCWGRRWRCSGHGGSWFSVWLWGWRSTFIKSSRCRRWHVSCVGRALPDCVSLGCCCLAVSVPASQVAVRHAATTCIKSRWRCKTTIKRTAVSRRHTSPTRTASRCTVGGCSYCPTWITIDLYKAYDFTEPWDGPKNKKLSATRSEDVCLPERLQCLASAAPQTSYVAVVGPNAAWAGEKPRKLADFGKEPPTRSCSSR